MTTYLNGRITPKEIASLVAAVIAACILPFVINNKLFAEDLKTTTSRLKNIERNLAFTNSQLSSMGGGKSTDSLKRQISLIHKELKKKGINPEETSANATPTAAIDARAELKNAQIINVLQRSGIRVKVTKPGKTGDAANSRDIEAEGSFAGLRKALIGLEAAEVNIEAMKLINDTKVNQLVISLSLTF